MGYHLPAVPQPRPAGYRSVQERIAMALERIADVLEVPTVAVPSAPADPFNVPSSGEGPCLFRRDVAVPSAPADPFNAICLHPEKARAYFGAMGDGDDEWECARARGGCGFRSPALVVATGG